MHHLILLTTDFPYGKGETFLETEIQYLSQSFEKVTLISSSENKESVRLVPANCTVLCYNKNVSRFDKLKSSLGVFSKYFWNEIKEVLKNPKLKLSTVVIKTALVSLFNANRLKSFILENLSDSENNILYSYWANDAAVAVALTYDSKISKKLCRAHGSDVYFEANSSNYLPYRSLLLRNLDILFPVSTLGEKYIITNWATNKIHAPLSVSKLGVVKQTVLNPKSEKKGFTIVSCSNVIPLKRINLIIEVLKKLDLNELKWFHFGDGPLRKELESKAKLDLKDKVDYRFMGQQTNTDLMEWYRNNSVDLFITLSSSEGIPVSIMEAMSFGIPVCATDVGGTAEIVNSGNGYLIDVDSNPEEIAKIIEGYLLSGKEEVLDKGRKALLTWSEKYNAEKNYNNFTQKLLNHL